MNWGHMLFGFRGRINRAKWWLTILVMIIIYLALVVAPQATSLPDALVILLTLVGLVLYVWIYLAAGAKRLHDLNRTGAWLVFFIGAPLVLTIIFVAIAWAAIGPAILAGQMPSEAELMRAGGIFAIFGLIGLGFFIWWLVWFGCLRGTVGPNNYGPDPLEGKV